MRVLWFTNIPLPAVDRHTGTETGGSGHWMIVLLEALKSTSDLELGVATAYPGRPSAEFEEDGVRYFLRGQPRFASHVAHGPEDLSWAADVVRRFEPDVVHVHGSERFYGLLGARGLVQPPVVISLQGLVSHVGKHVFGALSPLDVVRAMSLRELLTRRGLAWSYINYARAAGREEEILRGAQAVMGRTLWDEAQVRRFNPSVRYFYVGEMLRPEFHSRRWSIDTCRRRRIFTTNVGAPHRGTEVILDAVAILAREMDDVELCVAGALSARTAYGRFVERRIEQLHLERRVKRLGYLRGPVLADALQEAHAFVLSSLVENSPNSLCEAMRVGLPCVAAASGGVPSLVDDGRTGLLFPPGDAAVLAEQLRRVLTDDARAKRLGAAAREAAAARHDPGTILDQLLTAYRSLASGSGRVRAAGRLA